MNREIEVWADWQELGSPTLMGRLRSSLTRGKEVFSFTYEEQWLASGAARQLDPDLLLFGGPQYPKSGGVHDKNIPLGGEGGVAGLPEGVQAVSGVEAAQSHDGSGSFLSPEHARLFAADADHAAASRLNDS